MIQKRVLTWGLTCLIASSSPAVQAQNAPAPAVKTIPYNWKSVQMVGGGFVDGIVFHPTERGLRYARTDMGGAYRWDDAAKRWTPLLDWISYDDVNLMGVESIAVDPRDANRVYLACGTYSGNRNTAILRSNDRGKTWQRTAAPFTMGGNENGRGNGERLMVDPNDGNILYFGSRSAGLWKSTDRAVTWNQVTTFPDVTEVVAPPPAPVAGAPARRGGRGSRGSGVVFELFDPRSGGPNRASSTVYAGVSLMGRDNFYRSTDGGQTWAAVPGQPTQYRPNHAVLASNGMMFISYGTDPGPSRMNNGGVWKFNTNTGEWTDITPDKPDAANGRAFGYAAVSVDARNLQVVIASSFGRAQEDIFRSTDGGATWKPVFGGGGTYDNAAAPYVGRTGIHWLFDIEIDPFDPNHAMFTTGYGGHETFNLTEVDAGRPTKWSVMSTGIEETVALELLSPTKGAPLFTAVGDYGGMAHWNLDKPAPEGNYSNPHFLNTNGIAAGDLNADIVVRVGRNSGKDDTRRNIGYSLDGGKSWQPTLAMPQETSTYGLISVSTDGANWIWTPENSAPYRTTDRGATWTPIALPNNSRIVADRVNPRKFYTIDLFGGKLFSSSDGGATFTESALTLPNGLPTRGGNRGDNRGGQDRIYATPDKEGDLWIAAFEGLYHSTNSGKTFVKAAPVQQIHGFGFGKAAPNAAYSALYLIGIVNGVRGVFRSDDTGTNWLRINDDQHQWGLVLHVTGDPKVYGRVYVGTHGRGTFYADPVG
jgi:photosystem II stability/assembly factor-like uncharacterized protein